MSNDPQVYRWTKKDKCMHLLPAVPLILFYIGTLTLLAAHSWYLVAGFLLLWIATNASVMRICIGCPYCGGYCPGLCQLFFAPLLAAALYKGRKRQARPRSFKAELILLGLFGFGSYVFAFYWLFLLYWPGRAGAVLVLLGLLLLHMPLSFFILCPKCGYNTVCPMAKVHKTFK